MGAPNHAELVERLRAIGTHDWRLSFLAHTSDTAIEAAAALTASQARIADLEVTVASLRVALIASGRAAGGGLSDEVSNDFLMHVPAEVAAKVADLEATVAQLSDPIAVRVNILRGAIAIPADLVWLHDTNGPVAELRARIADLEAKLGEARETLEAADDARTRLFAFADQANAGQAEAGGRELSRKVWGAFADFDAIRARSILPTRGEGAVK